MHVFMLSLHISRRMGHSSVRSYGLEAGTGLFAMQKVRTQSLRPLWALKSMNSSKNYCTVTMAGLELGENINCQITHVKDAL